MTIILQSLPSRQCYDQVGFVHARVLCTVWMRVVAFLDQSQVLTKEKRQK